MRDAIFPHGASNRLKLARADTLFISGLLLLAWLVGAVLWWRGMFVDPDPLLTATFFEQVAVAEVRNGAIDLGVSPAIFPALWFVQEFILLFSFGFMALLLFTRKPDGFGTYLALAFVIVATSITGAVITRVDAIFPGWTAVVYDGLLGYVSFLALVSIAYVFPDGRFVPAWIKWVLVVTAGLPVVFVFVRTSLPPDLVERAGLVIALLMLGFGIASQIYRYFRVSGPIERQQLKGVILSLALLLTVAVVTSIVAPNVESFVEPATAYDLTAYMVSNYALTMAGVSLIAAISFAVLRYRLWEIDVFIRRTTSYAIVTGLLVLVYFGSVVVLQRLFTALTGQTSTIAIVLSTLIIAALFLPLRRRVQEAIDRRFFRSKYDAQKTLEEFAATVRDETDLDALTAELVRVIEDTMQPEHVSVWLAPETDTATDRLAQGEAKAA